MPKLLPSAARPGPAPSSPKGSSPAGDQDEARKRARSKRDAAQASGSAGDGRPRSRKENLHNEKTAAILQTIVKGTLRNMQDMRDIQNCVVDVLLGPSEDPLFEKMKEQTVAYAQLPQKDRDGPPHLVAFVGLVNSLVQKGPSIGAMNLQALDTYYKEVETMETDQLAEQVRMCRQIKCFQANQTRLVLEVGRSPVRRVLLDSLKQIGFRLCVGRAPAGHLERELQNWLDVL